MSLAYTSPEGVTCAYCDGQRDKHNSVEGSYCSKLCYHKHQGSKLLNTIRYDHTQCVNCGTQLKEISKPTDEQLRQIDGANSANAVIGFQYPTPRADVGVKDIQAENGERQVTGIVCGECGNTNHSEAFPEVQQRHLFEYAESILSTLEDNQEQHDKEINRDVFFDMLLATEDLVFSLGKAVDR